MKVYSDSKEKQTGFAWGLIGGLLLGGLVGSAVMLLVAPQSGRRTRALIQMRSSELRDQAMDAVEDAMKQTRKRARKLRSSLEDQTEAIQQMGSNIVDGQKERISTMVEAGKSAVQGVLNARS